MAPSLSLTCRSDPLTLAAADLTVGPTDCLISLDGVGYVGELALFLRSLWASLKSIGSQEQERMHRIGLG
jgi:hypothetical protein